MNTIDNQIRNNITIEDFEENDNIIKLYPYYSRLQDSDYDFLRNETTTIVGIQPLKPRDIANVDQDNVNPFLTMTEDENGFKYVPIAGAVDVSTQDVKDISSKTTQQVLKEILSFVAIVNDFTVDVNRSILFFTINQPFDKDLYLAGKQNVYEKSNVNVFDDNSILSVKEDPQLKNYITHATTVSELTFVNVNVRLSKFSGAKIIFEDNDRYWNHTGASNPTITVPTQSWIGKIYGRGKTNIGDDIDFTTKDKLPIIKGTPIDTTDGRVSHYIAWNDFNQVLPLYVINKFHTAKNLSELFKDEHGVYIPDGEKLFKLLQDMILYSYMYQTQWTKVVPADRVDSTGSVSYGAIKNEITVGSTAKPINMIQNKSASTIIQGLYETWILDNHDYDRNSIVLFKAACAALSKYIISDDRTIAGGDNYFADIFLPWSLELAINLDVGHDSSGTNYVLTNEPKVRWKSNWYDTTTGTTIHNKIRDLSRTEFIRSERNITSPNIPPQLSTINISTNLSDITPSNDTYLKYLWSVPIPDDKFINTLWFANSNSVSHTVNNLSYSNTSDNVSLLYIWDSTFTVDHTFGTSSDWAKIAYTLSNTQHQDVEPLTPEEFDLGWTPFETKDWIFKNWTDTTNIFHDNLGLDRLNGKIYIRPSGLYKTFVKPILKAKGVDKLNATKVTISSNSGSILLSDLIDAINGHGGKDTLSNSIIFRDILKDWLLEQEANSYTSFNKTIIWASSGRHEYVGYYSDKDSPGTYVLEMDDIHDQFLFRNPSSPAGQQLSHFYEYFNLKNITSQLDENNTIYTHQLTKQDMAFALGIPESNITNVKSLPEFVVIYDVKALPNLPSKLYDVFMRGTFDFQYKTSNTYISNATITVSGGVSNTVNLSDSLVIVDSETYNAFLFDYGLISQSGEYRLELQTDSIQTIESMREITTYLWNTPNYKFTLNNITYNIDTGWKDDESIVYHGILLR